MGVDMNIKILASCHSIRQSTNSEVRVRLVSGLHDHAKNVGFSTNITLTFVQGNVLIGCFVSRKPHLTSDMHASEESREGWVKMQSQHRAVGWPGDEPGPRNIANLDKLTVMLRRGIALRRVICGI